MQRTINLFNPTNSKRTAHVCAAASLAGHASNVTGAAWPIAVAAAGDGLAHQITIRNDSATNHSGKTVTLVGEDLRGNPLTETLAAPGASATVTSANFFATLASATPSATIGADTFDIGWTAAAVSPWLSVTPDGHLHTPTCSVAVSVEGTVNYSVEHTYDPELVGAAFTHTGLASQTTSQDGQYVAPVAAVRVKVNSHTSGVVTLHLLQ